MFSLLVGAHALSCIDSTGAPIDTFQGLRIPKAAKYIPLTADGPQPLEDLNDMTVAISRTVLQIYNAPTDGSVAYVLYNDQPPDGSNHEGNAHSKGFLAFDASGGFWLLHSQPKWPPVLADGYTAYTTDVMYAQSYICMSLSLATLDSVAKLFQVNNPFVYDSALSDALAAQVPNLAALLSGTIVQGAKATSQTIATVGGRQIVQFAKNKAWDARLYYELVSPTYNTPFAFQTWINGAGNLGSYCAGKYTCQYTDLEILQITASPSHVWTAHQSHSKWGVSLDKNTPVFCVSDINREKSQAERGGGCVCISDPALWSVYRAMDTNTSSCVSCDDSRR